MFKMETIARKIRQARIAKNMTQMDLADEMGVSYQAVSNWERAQSAPDIGKLQHLCEVLELDLEELLGWEVSVETLKQVVEEPAAAQALTPEQLTELAPVLPPAAVEEGTTREGAVFTIEQVVELAPFLSDEALDLLLERCPTPTPKQLAALMPFLSGETLAARARAVLENGGTVKELLELAPFLDEDDLGEIAKGVLENGGTVKELLDLAPFLDEDDLGQIAKGVLANGGTVEDLLDLAPFLDEDELTDLVERHPPRSLAELTALLPFLDEDRLPDILRRMQG